MKYQSLKTQLLGGIAAAVLTSASAYAANFNVPGGDLVPALDAYQAQSGIPVVVAANAVRNIKTHGVKGDLPAGAALAIILRGTGFVATPGLSGVMEIVPVPKKTSEAVEPVTRLAEAAPAHAAATVETVVVTSSKIKGDIQTVPIAITALSQEQLTSRQIAGGPDLVKEVPNLTFTKTNFTGYSIQIRGIGTQAISATTDPAVAVAFNDVPFLSNHFFEQEFYDVSQVEVVRGPQGTLYGRNATAGVVNVISAKPTGQFEMMLSGDVGNYNNRRLEGMLNIPVLDDVIDLRLAGEWTKRDGYAYNLETDRSIDGRDLFSTRASLLFHPVESLTATGIWEHFQERDNRARSTKQLCARDDAPTVVDGPTGPQYPGDFEGSNLGKPWLSQGCRRASLYSSQSYETPDVGGAPFFAPFVIFSALSGYVPGAKWTDPYGGVVQPRDLRTISSQIDPTYRAKNDTFEFNVDYAVTPGLTFTSQTAYSNDFLYSTQDFNRFNTTDTFLQDRALQASNIPFYDLFPGTFIGQDNLFCDPQLGCSSRFLAEDRSSATARQFYQEVRLSSAFEGPLNFVVGANYLNYRTSADYYVFSNLLTLMAIGQANTVYGHGTRGTDAPHIPFDEAIANSCGAQPADPANIARPYAGGLGCLYVDPNPIDRVNGEGHNYFLSHNPYRLRSWAAFGEVYYQIAPDLKLTGGLRFTDDIKKFPEYPSWSLIEGKGIPQQGEVDQEWQEVTGRAVANWNPKLDFTDETFIYTSYAHGYKGGGANPPGVTPLCNDYTCYSSPSNQTHPLTFKPEFNDAFELGTKNTALDGALTLNADIFYYAYKNYQISQIVDRTAINLNFNATVRGAEIETSWSPLPGLKLGFNGGYENATINSDQYSIDLMDRTAGHAGWMVVRPWPTSTSNCVLPTYVVNEFLAGNGRGGAIALGCLFAYSGLQYDPITTVPYVENPDPVNLPGYAGFDPATAPNNGEGFEKNVGGNQLPNAPHFTTSLTADFTMPVSENWAATLHGDFYWQSQSWWRVFNDSSYDKLRGYSNVNLALILTGADGWQVIGYVKNIFNKTAITGAFLNSDDTSLTTNVFVTDPRLFGMRVTRNF